MPITERRRALSGLLTLGAAATVRAQSAASAPASGAPLVVFGDRSLPPFSFLNAGRPTGAYVDLCEALAAELRRPLDMRLGDWAEAQAAVLRGEGDVLPPVASTSERALHFAFTQPVGRNEFALFAREDEADRVANSRAEELAIGVTSGGYPRQHFSSRHPAARLTIVQDAVDGLRKVQLRQIDAYASNSAAVHSFLHDLKIAGIVAAAAPFAVLEVAIAVHRRNPALLTELDAALEALRRRGDIARMEARWLDAPPVALSRTQLGALVGGTAGAVALAALGVGFLAQRRRLRERDAEIARRLEVEAKLEAARAAAERAARAKTAFLANMSHEIRTPMNAIVGMSRMLRDTLGMPAESHQRLRKLDDAARHLLAMVSDVLDMSKIEANKLELESIRFDLPALLESVRSNIGALAEQKGLPLVIEHAADCPRVVGDPTRLRQSILNLLSNAIKFTDHGQVRLTAQLLQRDAQKLTLRFEVEDTGCGISRDLMGRLFQPFEQEDGSVMRQYGGTGLGLSITKHLVEMMGGEIGCRSEPGRGSLFWFTVQLTEATPEPEPSLLENLERASERLRERWPGTTVLVADDNAVNLEVTRAVLESLGLRVIEARDGEEAIRLATTQTPRMVLMDVRMPGMDGIQATVALRQLYSALALPVVALTANAFEEDRRECMLAGMNDFLSKPVDIELLAGCVLKWLDRSAAALPTTTPAAGVKP